MPKDNRPVIYETATYCGRLKEWRILNINTGTVYSSHFNTEEGAYHAIEDGVERAGAVVKRVKREEIIKVLESALFLYR